MSENRLESNRLCSSVNVIFRTSFFMLLLSLVILSLELVFLRHKFLVLFTKTFYLLLE